MRLDVGLQAAVVRESFPTNGTRLAARGAVGCLCVHLEVVGRQVSFVTFFALVRSGAAVVVEVKLVAVVEVETLVALLAVVRLQPAVQPPVVVVQRVFGFESFAADVTLEAQRMDFYVFSVLSFV